MKDKDIVIDVEKDEMNFKGDLENAYRTWNMISMFLTVVWFISLFFNNWRFVCFVMMLVYQTGLTGHDLKRKYEQV